LGLGVSSGSFFFFFFFFFCLFRRRRDLKREVPRGVDAY
jgi:hypothetical protein